MPPHGRLVPGGVHALDVVVQLRPGEVLDEEVREAHRHPAELAAERERRNPGAFSLAQFASSSAKVFGGFTPTFSNISLR
jgi:hypothetical protein